MKRFLKWRRKTEPVTVTEDEPTGKIIIKSPWHMPMDKFFTSVNNDGKTVEHRGNVVWFNAELPPVKHDCYVHSRVWHKDELVCRCACGAHSYNGKYWFEKNSRRKDLGVA